MQQEEREREERKKKQQELDEQRKKQEEIEKQEAAIRVSKMLLWEYFSSVCLFVFYIILQEALEVFLKREE